MSGAPPPGAGGRALWTSMCSPTGTRCWNCPNCSLRMRDYMSVGSCWCRWRRSRRGGGIRCSAARRRSCSQRYRARRPPVSAAGPDPAAGDDPDRMAETRTPKAGTYLITGGSGSGKSGFAQRLAAHLGAPVAYLATGRATTTEMAARIRKHRQSRPPDWLTIEAPRQLAPALAGGASGASVVLLDDLPSLLSTCLGAVEATDG